MILPIAVDAMGGDQAPDEIVAGARRAADELGIPVVLVGRPDDLAADDSAACRVIAASEVIAMDDDPAQGVRRKKDSSLVRAAEAVRDGKASAMVSAGNTGADDGVGPAAHGPHQGREPAGHRHPASPCPAPRPPSCSTPAPTPSASPSGWCSSPRWARCSPATASASPSPGSACCRSARRRRKGNAAGQGDPRALLAERRRACDFVGNVEGRDIMTDDVDVVVTDGFTGNVVLKTLEGG